MDNIRPYSSHGPYTAIDSLLAVPGPCTRPCTVPDPVSQVPPGTPGTLDTGYLPVYHIEVTLHLGTPSVLDSWTMLAPVLYTVSGTPGTDRGGYPGSPTYQVPGTRVQEGPTYLPGSIYRGI